MTNKSENQLDIYLEVGKTKVFACAVDWPGWCRSGRNEESAIYSLQSYAQRYANIIKPVGLAIVSPHTVDDFTIIERTDGNYATNYGVPDLPIPADYGPLSLEQIGRFSKILKACWLAFDQAARAAEGRELRKGPRGGGRELTEIINHVAQAEKGYLRRLGWNGVIPEETEIRLWMDHVHGEILEGIQAATRGEYPKEGPHGGKRWPPAYFIRRVAWHALDHAWEIEDRIM